MSVKFQNMKKKKNAKVTGSFSYSDPATPIAFQAAKIRSLTFNGSQAHFTGTSKIGKKKVSFTVDVTDNGDPGTNDFFSLQLSNGYSASGNLTAGNIHITN
jgi:hypothetical protein